MPFPAAGAGVVGAGAAAPWALGPVVATGPTGSGPVRLQADQQSTANSSATSAAGPNRSIQGRLGSSGVSHGWIGSETGARSDTLGIFRSRGAADSRPLTR